MQGGGDFPRPAYPAKRVAANGFLAEWRLTADLLPQQVPDSHFAEEYKTMLAHDAVSLTVLWSAVLPQPPAAPPVQWGELLLLPTTTGLQALSLADGSPRWHFALEGAFPSGVTGAGNRALLAASSTDPRGTQGVLVALDHAGQVRWRWEPGLRQVSAAAVQGQCVTVTALGNDASMFVSLALADGQEQHRSALPHTPARNAPTIVGDLALIPCTGPQLLAVELAGDLRWRVELPGEAWFYRSPCVAGETVITVSSTGAVLALRLADGARLWQREVGPAGKPLSAPATDGERVFVGARDGLYALRLRNGDLAWHFPTGRRIEAAPALAGATLYVAGHDHHLYALDAVTGEERWRTSVKHRIETPPLLAECAGQPCIIVADEGGAVTALALPQPATSPGQVVRCYCRPVYNDTDTVQWGGAVAQGPGSTALGAGAVQVGGNVGGDVITGTKIETGGGAYIDGNVNTGGGDFIGRDLVLKHDVRGVNLENLRLDAAVPDKVYIERSFELAVSIRQINSPRLSEQGLPRMSSGAVQVAWFPDDKSSGEFIRLRIEISSPECEIEGNSYQSFRLYYSQDSPIFYFHLIPKKLGEIGIIIKVYQEDDWLGSARVHTKAFDKVIGGAKLRIISRKIPDDMRKDEIWTTAALRARLQRLDAVDIESLCLDHFPAVYDKFTRGLQRGEMINLLLDHCRRNPEAAARLAQLLP